MFKFLRQDQFFTALILVVGTFLLALSGVLLRFDYVFYDIGQYISRKTVPNDIVIVAIDEPSLDRLGKWPWTRETHAQIIEKIHQDQPAVIALDILFSEADMLHPADDMRLAKAINNAGNIILPIVIESPYPGAAVVKHESLPTFLKSASGAGRVNVPLDGDGIARGIYLWEGVAVANTADLHPHFAYKVLEVTDQFPASLEEKYSSDDEKVASNGGVKQKGYRKIDFAGPASSFKQVSYADVWLGKIPPDYFREKIVLVGATAIGMGDFIATPMSGFSSPMSGVEFNANVIAAMRGNELITDMPLVASWILSIVLVVLPLFWMPKETPLRALLLNFAYVLFIIAMAVMLPTTLHVWYKPSALLLMVLFAYPIWSWRRLDRAHAHLNVELQQLKQDLQEFGMQPNEVESVNRESRLSEDLLQSRITQVRYASQLLRDLQNKKNESLAFISHDLRTPLATAMMMLNEQDFVKKKDRVIAMLDQANLLAENFLSISKAETLNQASFKEVELSGMLQEAVDHVYQLAKQKSIKIRLYLPEEPAWVKGEFSLLHRACVNLLTNAIKFSSEQGLVEVTLVANNGYAEIRVKDYGEGIASEKLEQVFVKFKRLDGQPVMQGSGLGLYFVDITTKKHGGLVSVQSEPGKWAQFVISLPILVFDEDDE